MTEIVNSTSLSDTLLQILQQLSPHEEDEQSIISAILCSIGAMGRIKQMAFLARKEEQIEDQIIPLKPRLLGFMFEKRVFRVSNKFIDSMNSRRFGFIAAGEQALGNIPVPGKNFRAITYDEKGGVIRLGWLEVFRWIPTKDEYRITFEVDLRDDVPSNTIRIFHEYNESPIVFVNVPKKLKIYLAHDNLARTKYENKIFEIPKPSKEKIGEYEKVIDYNMDLPKQN
ncbi:MAG: hypothetical protein EZS28_019873 [Streblomastix strix]|uniref:Uncharacterized protein n=1 Tax=Streblomastix strix TaxID=222440 RepID=A0A5J4VQP0_9EUKA|nr:MAG: hypothetical protein EZS28_019873 [Streblomastix strix]